MALASSSAKHGAVALIFPGQGSQFAGMARELVRDSPRAREIFRLADEVLGYGLTDVMQADDGTDLNRTVHTQPAIFVQSIALLECLRERCSLNVAMAAGHSLGEYTALVAAGALAFEEALDVIRVRARGMDEAQPPGSCCMAALVGVSRQDAVELIAQVRGDDVLEAANFNAPDQVVVSGHV
ncbi:MAG: ACP S-malonyltransferase, partial [Desulfomonile sp.]|nr:ACP S-malonyltransferase [Desulfomonile sp.]